MKYKNVILILISLLNISPLKAQENYKVQTDSFNIYTGGNPYEVKSYNSEFRKRRPKNIILMIGDGMGTTQVFAGMTANHGHLFLENFPVTGFSRTQSANKYITDSSAGGTALSTGQKTFNGAIGVNKDTIAIKTILELFEDRGLKTGLVSTSSITHATPASFIAHVGNRSSYEDIATFFLKTDIDVFIGGGYKHFTDRQDGRNLAKELEDKGYKVLRKMEDVTQIKSGKLAGLTSDEHNPRVSERGNMLPAATETSIKILSGSRKGFFLMVEGSQIDFGGHAGNTVQVVEEMLDFDKAIGKALEFASQNGETLIIVTADHETGGLSITDGDIETGKVTGVYGTKDHTAVMVPVFSYGPGAENFSGIMDNTDIHKKIVKLISK